MFGPLLPDRDGNPQQIVRKLTHEEKVEELLEKIHYRLGCLLALILVPGIAILLFAMSGM